MIPKKSIVLLLIFSLSTAALMVSAGITSNQTFTGAARWIQHPGIAVGKLFASSSQMITVVGDGNGFLHAWNPSGVEIAGFPVSLPNRSATPTGGIHRAYNDKVNSTPALVDINADGNLEIFVGSGDGWVYGYNNVGVALSGWPKFTGVSTGDGNYGVHSSPAVADIDGDGNFEVIVGAFSHLIWVWNAENGTVYPGWPFDNTDTVWSSPAVADLNRDGTLEIVIGCDSTVPAGGLLRVFRNTGEQMSGWPQFVDQILQSSPAIGDIDNDGLLEIVIGSGIFYAGSAPATKHPGEYVSAYEANGAKVTGWPASLSDGNLSTDNRVYGSPALADIDANGTLETFVGDMFGFLHCINSNGTIRWSQTPQVGNSASFAFLSSPVVGDIDGDGTMDVVIGGGFHLNAFNAATGVLKYSIYTGEGVVPFPPVFTWSTPTIADVDGDGLIELLIGTGREGTDGVHAAPANIGFVKVYHETGPAGTAPLGQTGVSQSTAPWARFHRSNRGTGSTNDTAASTGGSALISAATASPFIFSPNGDGIADTETIRFTLASTDTITVDILDRTGSIIAVPLNATSRIAGTHNVTWNGNNSSGALAVDGMYTFRIRGNSAAPVLGSFGLNNTVPEASTSWFLAEGSTVGFEAYVLVQNPNFSSVVVDFTFFRQDGTSKFHSEIIPARTRLTVPIHDPIKGVPNVFSVSTQVQASAPILVERAMYFNGNRGAHNSSGVTSTNRSWYFPANRAFAGDEDFILIVNPSTVSSTTVAATFIQEGLNPQVVNYPVAANSRFTIAVHGVIAAGTRASVSLQSTLPIAAERAFYVGNRAGGAGGIGAVSPSLSWYFAEGDTSNLFSPTTIPAATFLEMFNPGDLVATITANYMIEDGTVITRNYIIDGKRRLTLDLSNQVGPNVRFSIEVLANNPIVAERLMFSGSDVGDSIGSPTTAFVWNLAEGFTAFGFETWVIVSNPGNQTANITMDFLKQDGTTVTQNFTLASKRRLTVHVNTVPGIGGTSVSTQVTSSQPVVVERTMRFASRLGIHQAMGVR
ncbi:MAG: FG-GAP-like repeat-containing protein [Acidobacteriota bacterium]